MLVKDVDLDKIEPPGITVLWNGITSKENVEQYKLKVLSRRNNTIVQKPLDRIEEVPDEEQRNQSMKEKTSESQSVVEESQVYASAVVETENKSPVATTPSTAAAAAEISLG